jgi:hypothetical protein
VTRSLGTTIPSVAPLDLRKSTYLFRASAVTVWKGWSPDASAGGNTDNGVRSATAPASTPRPPHPTPATARGSLVREGHLAICAVAFSRSTRRIRHRQGKRHQQSGRRPGSKASPPMAMSGVRALDRGAPSAMLRLWLLVRTVRSPISCGRGRTPPPELRCRRSPRGSDAADRHGASVGPAKTTDPSHGSREHRSVRSAQRSAPRPRIVWLHWLTRWWRGFGQGTGILHSAQAQKDALLPSS